MRVRCPHSIQLVRFRFLWPNQSLHFWIYLCSGCVDDISVSLIQIIRNENEHRIICVLIFINRSTTVRRYKHKEWNMLLQSVTSVQVFLSVCRWHHRSPHRSAWKFITTHSSFFIWSLIFFQQQPEWFLLISIRASTAEWRDKETRKQKLIVQEWATNDGYPTTYWKKKKHIYLDRALLERAGVYYFIIAVASMCPVPLARCLLAINMLPFRICSRALTSPKRSKSKCANICYSSHIRIDRCIRRLSFGFLLVFRSNQESRKNDAANKWILVLIEN